jgi:large subunit ribosomal protein L31
LLQFEIQGKWLAPGSAGSTSGAGGLATQRYPGRIMKEGIHPNYREVLFVDVSNDFKFITRSTIQTRETGEFNGKEYPLAKIEVSSESHPFYTGQQKIMDTAGRIEKFRQKFGKRADGKVGGK